MRGIACLLLALVAYAAPLSLDDVRRLLAAGVTSEVVVAKLASSECAFRLTSDEVVALTTEGVPQDVIRAMITCGKAAQPLVVDPCGEQRSPVAFPDLEWDQAGVRFDLVTLLVSDAGVCLKRVEDQVRRPIPWASVAAICEEPGFYRHVYLKLKTIPPTLAPYVSDGTVLIFNGSPTALRPLFAYIRKVQPDLMVDCAVMEE